MIRTLILLLFLSVGWSVDQTIFPLPCQANGRAQIVNAICTYKTRDQTYTDAVNYNITRYSLTSLDPATFGFLASCDGDNFVSVNGTAVTSTDQCWDSGDVGMTIDIQGAGTAGATLRALIVAVGGPTACTINVSAPTTTVASKTSAVGIAVWGWPATTITEASPLKSLDGTLNYTRALTAPASNTGITYSVRDFGAVGNGTTDDTAAITGAFSAAKAAASAAGTFGATVYFPKGIYKTTSVITIPLYVNIKGETEEGTFISAKFNGDTFQDETTGGASYLYYTAIEELTVLKADTNGTNNTTGNIFTIRHNASFCNFRRLRLIGGSYAVNFENVGYSLWNTFDQVTSYYAQTAAVQVGQGSNMTRFQNCVFANCPIGVDCLLASVAVNFVGCDFEAYTTCAIKSGNAQIYVSGGYIEQTTAGIQPVWITGTGTVDVTGAYIKGNPAGAYLLKNDSTGFARFSHCLISDFNFSPPVTGAGTLGNIFFHANNIAGATNGNAKGSESGTFTPTLTFATPGDLSVAYTTRVGRYTKVGNRITIDVNIVTSSFTWTTAASYMRVTGIPYPSATSSGAQSKGAMNVSGLTKAGYTNFVASLEDTNNAGVAFYASGSGVASGTVNAADMPSGTNKTVQFTLSYETAW